MAEYIYSYHTSGTSYIEKKRHMSMKFIIHTAHPDNGLKGKILLNPSLYTRQIPGLQYYTATTGNTVYSVYQEKI